MKKYDYLIVGSGLFGSVFAYEATKRGNKCLVIDKRNHVGGNIYTENIEDINIHRYGAHIFYTDIWDVWKYIQQFAEFNRFTNSPLARYKDELYNLPFNMNTFHELWGVVTPDEAREIIANQVKQSGITEPHNLEEYAIMLVGIDIYEKLIKGYTEKQWGKKASDLPAMIIGRLPIRYVYDNNYYKVKYQGVPIGGYTSIIDKMLIGSEVQLNTDYFANKESLSGISNKVVFTGMIDAFFDYSYGQLEYRGLRFENEILDIDNYQGNAVVNYTDYAIPYTRIIEHKHFEFGKQKKTVITREYPIEWKPGDEPYYPINDARNNRLYSKYRLLADQRQEVIFGGRLGSYRYYNMSDVIQEALICVHNEFEKRI